MGALRVPIQRGLTMIAGVVVLAAFAAPAARAEYRIAGHGFGHGVGLAQYGAMGYAQQTNHTYRWILRHYYPGTTRAAIASARIRVRMKQATAARVSSATLAAGADGRRVPLSAQRTYRFVAWSADGLEVIDTASGHTLAHLHAPVRISGTSPLRLLGPAENGVTGGRYRGVLVLLRTGDEVLVVDDVGLEGYLYGVVPGEMPAAWPAEALRSQAVAARSYAVTSRRPTQAFDVYSDTRSQVYRGVTAETARTTDAVRATRGVVLMYGANVARTLFHSSSGGRTAAVEEIFGGTAVPYLQSVDDPYDRLSPHHDWTVTLTDDEVARRLESVVLGDLVDVEVVARTASGRAATVRVIGTLGARDVSGTSARSLLGLRSSWFTVQHEPATARSAS
jgi:stage II sporulation protein D